MTLEQEPFFPKPEGPTSHPVEQGETPESPEAPAKAPPVGADGFGVETTFIIDETTDPVTGIPSLVILPGDVFGGAEAASPMMYPNLAETGFAVPTYPGSRIGPALSNSSGVAWQQFFFQRFIATKSITVHSVRAVLNIPAAMNAQSKIGYGIYNEPGTQLLAKTNLLHVNTDLGCNGVPIWGSWPLTVPTSLKLVAGTTYMMVQTIPGGSSNGMFIMHTDTVNFSAFQDATIRFNGGNPAVLADKLRYGWEGVITYNVDPGVIPADLTTAGGGLATVNLQDSSAWLLVP